MKQHILIEEYEWSDGTAYPVDTAEEVEEALAAMRAVDCIQAIIWNGEPGCEGVYSSGTVLCTDEGA